MTPANSETTLITAPKKGQIVEFVVEKLADRGKALGRVGDYVVFVTGAAPGDRVRAQIRKRRKKYAEAALLEVLEYSSLRTDPVCTYHGVCGGCKWQHIQYPVQLETKRQSVYDALTRLGGFTDIEVQPTLGMDVPFLYRNKMEFSFGANRWLLQEEADTEGPVDKSFALGLHAPGRYDKVLDLTECHLQSELSAKIVNRVRAFTRGKGWTPWDVRTRTGYLRNLVIRSSWHTPDLMINLVTNGRDEEKMDQFAAFIQAEFPEVTTLINTINTGVALTVYGEAVDLLFGPGLIRDQIGPFLFEIGPQSFFQTNTRQAEVLYDAVVAGAEIQPGDLVYDLYCGAGTISLFLAQYARHVVGVELVPEAIENARTNASKNGVDNVEFFVGDLLRLFSTEFIEENGKPDVLVVDPPRAGMHPRIVEQISSMGPDRLVYVSCNPMTQARDLAALHDQYEIMSVQPVDLFPQTHHIESVVSLRRKGS